MKKKLILVLVLLVVLGFGGWGLYSFMNNTGSIAGLDVNSATGADGQPVDEGAIKDLLEKIGKHMILPTGQLTIATISDIDKLKEKQPFFLNAQNGDKVLLYTQARKAVVYSPEKDMIINVGALVVDTKAIIEEAKKKEGADWDTLKVEYRNASGKANFAQEVSGKVTKANARFQSTGESEASKEVDETIIVDTGKTKNFEMMSALAKYLGVKNGTVKYPEGEKESDAEILVILGKNTANPAPAAPQAAPATQAAPTGTTPSGSTTPAGSQNAPAGTTTPAAGQ